MKNRAQIVAGGLAVGIIAVSLGLVGTLRVREAREYSQPHRVKTYLGTNYVVQLAETAIGRIETGYVLIAYLRLENPNPHELVLDRNAFFLVDHDKDYYLPSSTGTQTELIKLPAHGVLEKEMFSFTVPDDTFEGLLALQVGQHYLITIKGEQPFQDVLKIGEFRSFQRRNW